MAAQASGSPASSPATPLGAPASLPATQWPPESPGTDAGSLDHESIPDVRPNTYGQILKSSALIGSSTLINIGLGIVRTKAIAVILGSTGIGLWGLYGAIADLARTVAGVGINSSGVRQIAEAAGTGDTQHIARTVTTLRRVALLLGALGALLLVVGRRWVSLLSFNDAQHAGAVALLGLAVFFGAVSAGQMALVQGLRRIGDLARMNVLGGLYGTVACVGLVYFYREQGVALSLVGVAGLGIATSWWYSRKIKVARVPMPLRALGAEASALLKLGLVFMAATLMALGVAYLVRVILTRQLGVDAAGYYQAAWTLGGLYIGFILQAMGADFFPRLTAVACDNAQCNRLVNEQAEVSMLLAGPGIIGTLSFASLIIHLFYAAGFDPAVELLRWICLGMALRVASWPMSFILLAKGARGPYFWTEFAANLAQVLLVWGCLRAFGLRGTGIAFFLGYVFYWCLIYVVVRVATGFRWSAANKRIGLFYSLIIAGLFAAWYWLPHPLVGAAGFVLTAWTAFHSLKRLCVLVASAQLPGPIRRLLAVLRWAPADAPAGRISPPP